ncbi:MAG: beta strand repeat-containing protein, partial [Chitinophagaceae bacterium]
MKQVLLKTRQMKSVFLALVMVILVGSSWGQSASATWALTADATVAVTGNVTGGSQLKGSGTGAITFGGTNGCSANGWDNASLSSVDYYEYSVTPTSGNNLSVTSTSFFYSVSGGSMNLAVYYSLNNFTSSTQLGSDVTGFSNTSSNVQFTNSTSISVNDGTTLKVRVYGWGASAGTRTFRNKTFVFSGTTSSAGTPSIAISTAHPAAADILQGSTNNILASYQLDVTTANATLTGVSVTTAGTYTSSDIATNGFKFWINSNNNLTGATQLGTNQAAVNSGGTVAVSGLSQSITSGTTRYILVTADIANSAVISNAISVTTTAFSSITFSGSVNKTGTDPASASNAQTIITCTGVNVTGAGATNGNTNSSVSWVNPSCFDEIMIVARAGSANDGTPTGDGNAYTANLSFNSGTAFGSGFVVYKGSSSPQVVTNLTNGTQYFFKIFTRKGTTWTSGVEVSATPASVTAATDYFRSNTASGDFATAGSWQSSVDNNTWITSTLVPTSSANTITIRNGHNIALTSSVTIDQLVILSGGQLSINSTSGTLNINDGTGNDVDIQSGGILQVTGTASYASTIIYSGSASINVAGKITIGDGTAASTGSGYGAFGFATATQVIWNNGAILEWNTSGATPGTSGQTYFPNVATTTIPIFRFAVTPSNPGGGSATVINGQLQLAANLTWAGAGLKTFRNGITATGTFALGVSSSGAWQIGDASIGNAEIGGNGGTLTLSNSNGISITTNCTATLSSNTVLSAGTLTNNGVLTCGTNVLSGAGAYTNAATGSVITSNTGGVNSTITVSGTKTYSAGSSFTFNANTSTPFPSTIGTNQVGTLNINANVTSNYASNLIITTACNINSGTFTLNGTNHLLLNNAVPFTVATGATFNNGGESQIQINSGTPTITINGTFITQDAEGFAGSNTSIPGITPTLNAGSTVEYGLAGTQVITTSPNYVNLTISGSGTKTPSGSTSLTGTLSISGTAILDGSISSRLVSGYTTLNIASGATYKIGGSGTLPDGSTFGLSNTSNIEFAGTSGTTIKNTGITYGNVIINNSNVSTGSTGITLQNGSTFSVASGITLNVDQVN